MKVQVKNCTACRKKIHEEEQEMYLKQQYSWLQDGISTMAALSATVAIAVQMQRGRSPEYIRKFFDDMVVLYNTGSVLGKKIELVPTMKMLEKEYGIDFKRINVNFSEDEKEYIKHCKEAIRNAKR